MLVTCYNRTYYTSGCCSGCSCYVAFDDGKKKLREVLCLVVLLKISFLIPWFVDTYL